MDFHIGVIQTIWQLHLTSFPGCTGARAKPEFKLYWSSQHHREPWRGQTVSRLVSSAQQGYFISQEGALWPGKPSKNLPPPPGEMPTCKGPQARAQRLKTPTPLPLQWARRKHRYKMSVLHSQHLQVGFLWPPNQSESSLKVLRAPEESVFCSSEDKKHLHSGFNYNWRWEDNQRLEELRLGRKRWTKSGVVAFVPVSSCKHL